MPPALPFWPYIPLPATIRFCYVALSKPFITYHHHPSHIVTPFYEWHMRSISFNAVAYLSVLPRSHRIPTTITPQILTRKDIHTLHSHARMSFHNQLHLSSVLSFKPVLLQKYFFCPFPTTPTYNYCNTSNSIMKTHTYS